MGWFTSGNQRVFLQFIIIPGRFGKNMLKLATVHPHFLRLSWFNNSSYATPSLPLAADFLDDVGSMWPLTQVVVDLSLNLQFICAQDGRDGSGSQKPKA